ncbi:glycoside hydrolase family 18 protein [Fusarium flagelliforme]|uniref:chitinase n=1 Tax=Fusarium flagelliforme TaxID=2675880 RepID=A0A395MYJ4_9HYPO|nr:glycoside hydrolase family 18 protein [Fusarium flagelliforme]
MDLKNLLLAVLALHPISVSSIPHHQHQHFHSLHKNALKARDAVDGGSQPVCPPIPKTLTVADDMIAKVRGEVCEPEVKFSIASVEIAAAEPDPDDPYACGQNKPCSNHACCGKNGVCGYGPNFCGTSGKSPNDKCWSNCDAHAECGRFAKTKGQLCPLNVCCSEYGFCGMTSEFCKESKEKGKGCQSKCQQPGSGSSSGDVQKRVIGYYEAWNYKKKCIGMSMEDIPVNSLTHIYYSFAYITPDTYDIVPMDDAKDGKLSTDTFTEFAGLKRKNPSLKAIVALGGWTFNDNHTIYQPVFSDLVSNQAKRLRFIGKLETFMERYGFDGVDIDWEYPGAGDRGGHEDDGENLTKLFKSMRSSFDFNFSGSHKEISFTAPTSYWYLQHFDLKASAKAVDYVNVMSYDLHGVWDAKNPIGSKVLSHSNITEIELALDLLWRNEVDPSKVNMGLGFYGRSFQLADPSCHKPGCLFKGGGAKGPCTDSSGTLAYFEIMDIIRKNKLTPYHDEEAAVKYITWDDDQWVSFDDFDTFQQKIDFANGLGLGGVLIWAIDLDTKDLEALSAVLYPKRLREYKDKSTKDTWASLGKGHCRLTDCGITGCRSGEIEIDQPDCSVDNDKHSVCCPFASAPNPKKCEWRGGDPYCNGRCHDGEVAVQSSKFGSGITAGYCQDGHKFLCCEAEAKVPDCRWTECDEECKSSENELTWKYNSCGKNKWKRFCCNKEEEWKNCKWHGEKGSCYDNHCDTGWQVSLTNSYDGEGDTCGSWLLRERTFCCDPPKGESPFLPVPLEYLFENPPDKESADTDWTLKVDNTYGGSIDMGFREDPKNSAFGFVVMTSPEELQTSLDKRDGSHWDVFDCLDSTTVGEHRVRMVCTDRSDNSNCDKIHLGHGAPGTILEMPDGCGPGRYAVAKSLVPSSNQTLPHHLWRRDLDSSEQVYDLVFDYDFKRVPRDLGTTQMRIDYSNKDGYWDTVVNKAADTKKRSLKRNVKRTLEDVNGSHKRWLEEEWRDDKHFGGLGKGDLHKRWFGEDVLDWLKKLVSGGSSGLDAGRVHSYRDEFTLSIVDQRFTCPNVDGKLEVLAQTEVDLETSYGFTLIATLGGKSGIDISDSYLYFRNKGEVRAKFVVDAAVTAEFDTDDVLMFSADKFGATFTVPGIVTLGPNFKLYGRLEGEATLGVNFESQVKLAEWDIRQTYPVENEDWAPEAETKPKKDGTQNVLEPEFEYGVSLSGYLSAHIKPTITFGIDFNEDFVSLDSCAVNLVADGHVTFHAEAETGSKGSSFCYGIDAGASLYATLDAPDAFSWALSKSPFHIGSTGERQIYPTSEQQTCVTPDSESSRRVRKRSESTPEESSIGTRSSMPRGLRKRETYGPLVPRINGLFCPGATDLGEIPKCSKCGDDDDEANTDSNKDKRDEDDNATCWLDPDRSGEPTCPADMEKRSWTGTSHWLDKRAVGKKWKDWEYNNVKYELELGHYPTCGSAPKKVIRWFGYPKKQVGGCKPELEKLTVAQVNSKEFATEHVYESQLIPQFLEWLHAKPLPGGYVNPSLAWVSEVLIGIESPIGPDRPFQHSDWDENNLWAEMVRVMPSDENLDKLALCDEGVNGRKGVFFKGNSPEAVNQKNEQRTRIMQRNVAGVFYYMARDEIWKIFRKTSQDVEQVLQEFDEEYPWEQNSVYSDGELGLPNRIAGQPTAGLRDLYCYFIDKVLKDIEIEAKNWLTASTNNYNAEYSGTPAHYAWTRSVLRAGGYISEKALKFRKAMGHRAPSSINPRIWPKSNYENLWMKEIGAAGPF